jgi:hypothetical protein
LHEKHSQNQRQIVAKSKKIVASTSMIGLQKARKDCRQEKAAETDKKAVGKDKKNRWLVITADKSRIEREYHKIPYYILLIISERVYDQKVNSVFCMPVPICRYGNSTDQGDRNRRVARRR